LRTGFNLYGLGLIFAISLFALSAVLPDAYAQATSEIKVHSLYSSGEIFGYYTVLSQGSSTVSTGYTVSTFSVNNGETYNVGVQDFGDFKFLEWQDTGSTIPDRDFSISSNKEFFAIYRNILDPSTSPDKPKLIVRTINSSGEEITGYWITLSQSDVIQQAGYSPEGFLVNNGETYEVFASDFDGMMFDRWEDGSTDNPRIISIISDTTITAYYKLKDESSDPKLIEGKIVGIQNDGNWKAVGPMEIGEYSFKGRGSGTYSTSGDGECQNFTGDGSLGDGEGNSIDIKFEGEICNVKPLIKGTIPFEITSGEGKYEGASGKGEYDLYILASIFSAKITGELEN